MTPERVREIFLAIKLHYTNEKYDYTKFTNRKLRGPQKADVFYYDKFSKKFSSENAAELFFIANMMRSFHKNFSIPTFIGDYYTVENFEYLKYWYSYVRKTLPYNYNQYLKQYETVDELIQPGRTLPKVFEDYLQEKISLDILTTFVYNNRNNQEIDMWEITASADPLFDKLYLIVKKHILFLKYKQILQ